jgi:uncharacterized membrane protein YuzA (DUF378 family)
LKHSQTIGLIATVVLIIICFLPWVTIESKDLVISGMNATGTDFGTPGKVNVIFSALMAVFFALPKVWAKRTNVFIGALNFSWSVKNYLVLSSCLMGECPTKMPALFALVALSGIGMFMTFFPKIEVEQGA